MGVLRVCRVGTRSAGDRALIHPLKTIRVKNFRSIVDQSFEVGDLTVVVGHNDAGKSNFLRAINLFFNSETDPGRLFDFAADFSTRASVGKGKARQIEITLDLQPPEGFSNRDLVRWKRYWREGSSRWVSEELYWLGTRKPIAGTAKIKPWLDRIKYKYVPAIKGREYFTLLLRDLHDTLAETVDAELRTASADFIAAIRGHTASISSTLTKSLGITSQLQLPSNLRSLFEVLDFETTSGSVPTSRSLQLRGDGVKVRHIAAILKFLADQERKISSKGKIRPTTIWGYEEPENNLELSRAFGHAQELMDYSAQVQIILTTHSPAFYSLAARGEPRVRGLIAISADFGTTLEPFTDSTASSLDESLGLMPLVAPYIVEQTEMLRKQDEAVEKLTAELSSANRPMVVVAGETDVSYIKAALSALRPDLLSRVTIEHLGSAGSGGSKGAGDGALDSLVRHWQNNPALGGRKALAIYDCDAPGKEITTSHLLVRRLVRIVNPVASKGIENLLPPELFADRHYDHSEKQKEYGGKVVTTDLNKKRLCSEVCDPAKFPECPLGVRFANFLPVTAWIEELLT